MKYKTILPLVLLQGLLCGCNGHLQAPNIDPNYDGIYAHQTPADITSLLDVYKWATETNDSIDQTEFVLKLVPAAGRYILADTPVDEIENKWYINMTDTIPVLCIPDNLRSKYNLYFNAEQYYNGNILLLNMESLYEVCVRSKSLPEEERIFEPEVVMDAIREIDVDVLRDPLDRLFVNDVRDSLLKYLEMDLDAWEEDIYPGYFLLEASVRFDKYCYFYHEGDYDTIEAFINRALDTIHTGLWAEERFERYLNADENEQLEVMLKEMSECKDFDEQCDLWCLWADCKKSLNEDLWLIAVGTKLMDSGNYTPYSVLLWLRWRVLFQEAFCGVSRDSAIPNDYYNEYRKKWYIASILHYEKHPDDIFSVFMSEYMLSPSNLNRLGGWFGNNALYEGPELMPKRYE